MEYNETYEQEIDLKDLMFVVLRRWRSILVTAVVLAVLTGGFKIGQSLHQQSDPEFLKTAEEDYQKELSMYELNKAAKEREIENLTVDIENQDQYMEKSVLMSISPYDVSVSSADFFVKTDYEIMPNMVYQNINYADSLIKSYAAAVKKDGLDKISDKENIDIKYLEELVTVDIDYNNDMFFVQVKHSDPKKADAIMDSIMNTLKGMRGKLSSAISNHTLSVMNETSSVTVDLTIADTQKAKKDYMNTLETSLRTKKDELEGLTEPTKPAVSKLSAVKSGIKYVLLGGVLGAFMVMFIVCVAFLMSDKVASAKELKNRFNIKTLGVLESKREKKAFGFVDRWLDKLEGVDVTTPEDIRYEVIAANIRNYARDSKTLLVTGTVDKAVLDTVAGKLKELLPGVQISCGEDMRVTAYTLEQLSRHEGVILVEKKGVSTYTGVSQEVETIKNVDKTTVGYILV
ncbi:MAG: chain-length determining protein [Hungatella sp.]|jgi:capsular polysaccharide biosynthesis protein|nr:chain-length determining protein [Hungatella sp.]